VGGSTTEAVTTEQPGDVVTAACSFGSTSESALVLSLTGRAPSPGAATVELYGFASLPGRKGFWNQPWLPLSTKAGYSSSFDMDEGGGINVLLSLGAVAAELTPGSSTATVLTTGLGFLKGAGEGDLAIWSMSNPDTNELSVQGWSPNGGVRTIVPFMATDTCQVGLSPSHMTGFTGDNSGQYCGIYSNPRLWATPRAYSPAEVKLAISPPFSPNPHYGSGKMVTWGDFIAAHAIDTTTPPGPYEFSGHYLLLARISDWKFRRLQPGGGDVINSNGFTLSDTHLYVAFEKTVASGTDRIGTVRRYDLTQFDQIGEAM
jgi:hypothetical protein